LVVKLPPLVEVGAAALLEADAVPGADLGQLAVAGDPPVALGKFSTCCQSGGTMRPRAPGTAGV
jgi:hypothetical protein